MQLTCSTSGHLNIPGSGTRYPVWHWQCAVLVCCQFVIVYGLVSCIAATVGMGQSYGAAAAVDCKVLGS